MLQSCFIVTINVNVQNNLEGDLKSISFHMLLSQHLARYSASPDDLETLDCFLDSQEIKKSERNLQTSVIDLLPSEQLFLRVSHFADRVIISALSKQGPRNLLTETGETREVASILPPLTNTTCTLSSLGIISHHGMLLSHTKPRRIKDGVPRAKILQEQHLYKCFTQQLSLLNSRQENEIQSDK